MDQAKYSAMVSACVKPGVDIVNSLSPLQAHQLHMVVGICGEAGELIDAVKKHVIYSKPLDTENVIEELGDIEWYMEGLRMSLGVTREQTLEKNYDKLMKKRYPNGYSDAAAQARADK